jgi:hypothetical protein
MRYALAALFMLCGSAQATVMPACGELIPRTNGLPIPAPRPWVHYVPKLCSTVPINGAPEKIPAGVAVVSGGLQGDSLNACIDKVCGQKLAPSTFYRVYAYMDQGEMRMDFSRSWHIEHPEWGYHVHVDDPSRTFIGLVLTNTLGTFGGGSNSLTIMSWPPHTGGRTGFVDFIGLNQGTTYLETCSPNFVIPDAKDKNGAIVAGKKHVIELLTFGINAQFREGWTVPNFTVEGMVKNTEVGKRVMVSVGVERKNEPVIIAGTILGVRQRYAGDEHPIHSTAIGAGGSEEGVLRAYVMMAAPDGGCAQMPTGRIFSTPHG